MNQRVDNDGQGGEDQAEVDNPEVSPWPGQRFWRVGVGAGENLGSGIHLKPPVLDWLYCTNGIVIVFPFEPRSWRSEKSTMPKNPEVSSGLDRGFWTVEFNWVRSWEPKCVWWFRYVILEYWLLLFTIIAFLFVVSQDRGCKKKKSIIFNLYLRLVTGFWAWSLCEWGFVKRNTLEATFAHQVVWL